MAELSDILKNGVPKYVARDVLNVETPRYDYKTSSGLLKASYFWDSAEDSIKIELYDEATSAVKSALHITEYGLKYINGALGEQPIPFVDDALGKLYYYDSSNTLQEVETPTGLYRVKEYYDQTHFNTGWALKGVDRALKKVIGQNAIDFTTYASNVNSPYEMGARGNNSVAFMDSLVTGNSSIVMGTSSNLSGDFSLILGSNSNVTSNYSVCVGSSSVVTANDAIVIGSSSRSNSEGSVTIGNGIQTNDTNVAVNLNNTLVFYKDGTVRLPHLNPLDFTHDKQLITKEYAEHIISNGGTGFTEVPGAVQGTSGLAPVLFLSLRPNKGNIGDHAIDASIYTDSGHTDTGRYSASFNNSIASGVYAFAAVQGKASGDNSAAIGPGAVSSNQETLALGGYASASGLRSICLGSGVSSGTNSIAISDDYYYSGHTPTTASGVHSIAIGGGSQASASYTVAISGGVANYDNSVMIGQGATGDLNFSVLGAFVLDRNNVPLAPNLSLNQVTEPRSLVTKEYVDIKFQNSGQDYPGVVKVDGGIRLLAEYTNTHHVTTGVNAVDFSLTTNSNDPVGASGANSFAFGKGAYAANDDTIAISTDPSYQTKADTDNRIVIGSGTPINPIEVANELIITVNGGIIGLEVASSGKVYLPSSTPAAIRNAISSKVLVTREFVEDEFSNLQTLGITGSGLNYSQDKDGTYLYYYLNGYGVPAQQISRGSGTIDLSMRASVSSSPTNAILIGNQASVNYNLPSYSSQIALGAGAVAGYSNSVVIGHNINLYKFSGAAILAHSGAPSSKFHNDSGAVIGTDSRLVTANGNRVSVGDHSFYDATGNAPSIGIGFNFSSADSSFIYNSKLFIGTTATPVVQADQNGVIIYPQTQLSDILNAGNPQVAATKEYADYKMGTLRVDTDFTATSGQTTFNISYDVSRINVFLNGGKLRNGVDYTATTGTDITLTSPATAGAWVQVVTW
jgi:hypothetical protein